MIFYKAIENLRELILLEASGQSYFLSQEDTMFEVCPDDGADKFTYEELVHALGDEVFICDTLDVVRLVRYNSRLIDYALVCSAFGPVYGLGINRRASQVLSEKMVWGHALFCPKSCLRKEDFAPSVLFK